MKKAFLFVLSIFVLLCVVVIGFKKPSQEKYLHKENEVEYFIAKKFDFKNPTLKCDKNHNFINPYGAQVEDKYKIHNLLDVFVDNDNDVFDAQKVFNDASQKVDEEGKNYYKRFIPILRTEVAQNQSGDLIVYNYSNGLGVKLSPKDNSLVPVEYRFKDSDCWLKEKHDGDIKEFVLLKNDKTLSTIKINGENEFVENEKPDKEVVFEAFRDICSNKKRMEQYKQYCGFLPNCHPIVAFIDKMSDYGRCKFLYLDGDIYDIKSYSVDWYVDNVICNNERFENFCDKMKTKANECCTIDSTKNVFLSKIMVQNSDNFFNAIPSQNLQNVLTNPSLYKGNIPLLFTHMVMLHEVVVAYFKEVNKFVILNSNSADKKYYDFFENNSLVINAQDLGYGQIGESCYTCSSLNAQMLSEIVNNNNKYKIILEDLKQDEIDILSQEMNGKYNQKTPSEYGFIFKKV